MNDEKYTYDVAFSFLAQDEPLAATLNDLLQDRFKTFIYSENQREIAGTDGEEKFSLVFGEQARMVVVLYRKGWGESPWTRIEETAIKRRGFNNGYDFLHFIPLEDPPAVPKWLAPTYVWIGLDRWGPKGAASVLEKRVQELGGEPHEETVENRAARLERSLRFDEERKQFLKSERGVNAANKEFEALHVEIQRLIESVKGTASSIVMDLKRSPQKLVILGLRHYGLSVFWHYRYTNCIDDAELEVSIWNGHPPFPGAESIITFDNPEKLHSVKFTFDLLPTGQVSWVSKSSGRSAYNTKDLASFILKYYMDSEI